MTSSPTANPCAAAVVTVAVAAGRFDDAGDRRGAAGNGGGYRVDRIQRASREVFERGCGCGAVQTKVNRAKRPRP